MIKKCYCGKKFKTFPSKIALGRGKYCSKRCADESFKGKRFSSKTEFTKGQRPHNFKGLHLNDAGYVLIYSPEHPNKDARNCVREHRLVMEKHLGRYLAKDEQVHHINNDKQDNRIENLMIVTHQEHMAIRGLLVLKRWRKQDFLAN